MNKKMIRSGLVLATGMLFLGGCSGPASATSAPALVPATLTSLPVTQTPPAPSSPTHVPATLTSLPPTQTPPEPSSPTRTDTLLPTSTLWPDCPIASPDLAYVLAPNPSGLAGWCEVEYGDFTLSYPVDWVLDAGGAWNQTRTFHVPVPSAQAAEIKAIAVSSDKPIDQAGEIVIEVKEGGQTFQIPIIAETEHHEGAILQAFGNTEVLIYTTTSGDNLIRRYFWPSPQPFLGDTRAYLVISLTGLTSDYVDRKYAPVQSRLEEMLSLLKVTPTCADGFTRLHPGIYARVTAGDLPNRVRSEPSKSAESIAQIYAGTVVSVTGRPVCADGLVFWKVSGASIPGGSGWTAEGDFTDYYLEPVVP